jgi:hypothetical protein
VFLAKYGDFDEGTIKKLIDKPTLPGYLGREREKIGSRSQNTRNHNTISATALPLQKTLHLRLPRSRVSLNKTSPLHRTTVG